MKQIWIRIALYGLLLLLLAACGQVVAPALPAEAPTAIETRSGLEPALPTGESNMTEPSPPSGMEALIEQAMEDLAQRLSISVSQISLVEAREVVWPDASLGCPQPGMAYIQVPQDGALIRLKAHEKEYKYHSGGNRGLFLCEQSMKDPYTPSQLDLNNLTPPSPGKINPTAPSPDNGIPPGEGQ